MKEINSREIKENALSLIADDWALLSAGDKNAWNTMTISWGGIGELWGRDVAFVFIRPQRHTKSFVDNNEYFTLSFFDEEYKNALKICGSKSGRDIDKAKETGLVPVFENETTFFEQAKLVIICKKIARQDMDPKGFLDESIIKNYKENDFHTSYVGEIIKVLKNN